MIRELTNADMDAALSLTRSNMHAYYLERDEPWNEHAIRDYFLSKKGIVLTKRDELEACSFYELKKDELHIHTLQVAPELQNKLTGFKLFRWYWKTANNVNVKAITCGVYASNPAFAMYLRMGFIEVGRDNGVVQLTLSLNSLEWKNIP